VGLTPVEFYQDFGALCNFSLLSDCDLCQKEIEKKLILNTKGVGLATSIYDDQVV
jgi:hypothetical protein